MPIDATPFSGSEDGSYLRLVDFVYHSTLGLRVIKKKKKHVIGVSDFRKFRGYRGTSLTRNRPTLGPYSRPMPRALWWS